MSKDNSQRGDASRVLLIGLAASLPLSISLAEGFVFLSLGWWVVRYRTRCRKTIRSDPLGWPVLAFVCAAGLTVLWSVRPADSLHRMHRLLIPFVIFAVADFLRESPDGGPGRAIEVAGWFVAACAARAVYDFFRVSHGVSGGAEFALLGTMRDPQMYMAALALVLAAASGPAGRRWRPFLVVAGAFLGGGLLVHGKRGVWISTVLAVTWMGVRVRRWWVLALVAGVVTMALATPQVRHRIDQLDDVRLESTGARMALWRNVAPPLLRQYPQGMGWCAVEHEDLAAHTPYLQPKLNHLHNNLLQVVLETGWLGLLCWLIWMGKGWWGLYRLGGRGVEGGGGALGVGLWTAFTGLLLNGLVEYNFGDTEVLILLCLLMGLSSGMRPASPDQVADLSLGC